MKKVFLITLLAFISMSAGSSNSPKTKHELAPAINDLADKVKDLNEKLNQIR